MAATSAAALKIPNANVREKASATPRATATINQAIHHTEPTFYQEMFQVYVAA